MTIPYPYVIILTNKNGLIVDCNHVSNTFFSRNVKVGENILTYLKQETIKNSPENHKKSSKILSYYFFIDKMKRQSRNK